MYSFKSNWCGGEFYNSIKKEENVLFHDTRSTFYLRLYGVRHMVKDHSDIERGNPLLPLGLLFPISSKGSFYMHHPTERIAHTMAYLSVGCSEINLSA